MMPAPASVMASMASSNCWRQSQRREWKTSPVRHWEWIRTIGGVEWMSPITRAIADSVRTAGAGMLSLHREGFSTMPSKPKMRKCPQRVGKSASATFFTLSNAMLRFYLSRNRSVERRWPRGERGQHSNMPRDLLQYSDAGLQVLLVAAVGGAHQRRAGDSGAAVAGQVETDDNCVRASGAGRRFDG